MIEPTTKQIEIIEKNNEIAKTCKTIEHYVNEPSRKNASYLISEIIYKKKEI